MTSRPNRILAIVVGVIAVIGVVAGVLSATRQVPKYERGTPVGVVQAYLTAVIDGDHQDAVGLLEGSTCTVGDLDRAYLPDDVRVVLRDSEVAGDAAQVKVDVVMPSEGPLDGSEYVEKHTFRLTRTGGQWLISGSPWPMYECGMEE
ncbi:MAG TPA: hypothetical protein VF165_16570 [Nocardioidaceae bacterium]